MFMEDTMVERLAESEFVISPQGRIYHLDLIPEELADTVLLVGDPARVPLVSQYFDRIELQHQHREFITHTGYVGKKRLTVLSTGMSTANIEIVLTELDALVNVNFKTRLINERHCSLDIIRVGTAGTPQVDIEMGSMVMASAAIGLDNALHFYQRPISATERELAKIFNDAWQKHSTTIIPYFAEANADLLYLFGEKCQQGLVVTCPGFYAAQGRTVRAQPAIADLISYLQSFRFGEQRVAKIEMETSGLYGMGRSLGHRCCSISTIMAERSRGRFHTKPDQAVDEMIRYVLGKVQ